MVLGLKKVSFKTLINDYHVENHVFLRGFLNDLTEEFKQHMLI